jgi:hypothetical protein
MENEGNSLRSDTFISDPFSAAHKRLRLQRLNVKSNVNATAESIKLTLESLS